MDKEKSKAVNYFGMEYDLQSTEILQEINVLSGKEKETHQYGGEYYQDALRDVAELIKRIKG